MGSTVRYILVHESCHGAWCWRDVLPKLENAVAIDLPSHGEDTTPIFEVTLESYVEALIKEINKSKESFVLVGHSAAGIAISLVAERIPERVSHLIFLCAYVPKDGDAINLMRKRAKRKLIMPAVLISKDRLSYKIDPIKAPGIFYHDCPPAAVDYAIAHLGPQPVLPQKTPVKLGVNYDSVPRSYILCENDHTVPPEEQEKFVADWPQNDVYRLHCGHSPFCNQPVNLADLLGVITKGIT